MAQFFNYNSFLLTIVLVFIGLVVAVLRRSPDRRPQPRQLAYIGGAAAVLILVYLGVRPDAAASGQVDEIRAQIGAGTPVLLEFQSQN